MSSGEDSGLVPIASPLATNKLGEILVSQTWEGQQESVGNQHCWGTANYIRNRQAVLTPKEQGGHKHDMLKFPPARTMGCVHAADAVLT